MKEGPKIQKAAVEDAVAFLKKVPPFQFLEDRTLRELALAIELEYYPTGSVILEQGGPPSEHLLVIKKGGAKVFVRSPEGEESLVDYRAEGDVIGFVSLYAGDRSRTNVVATSDTICYLIGKADFRRLLDAHPLIREYLHRAFLTKYLDKTIHEMRTRSVLAGGGERLLFTTPVGELATGAVVTAPLGPPDPGRGRADRAATGSRAHPPRCRRRPRRDPHRPRHPRQGRRRRPRPRRSGRRDHERADRVRRRAGLLLRGAADDDPPQHPPRARHGVRGGARDHHEPRPDDPPGDLAALGRPGGGAAAGRPGARGRGAQGLADRRAAAQGGGARGEHHPRGDRDQRPDRAPGARDRRAPRRPRAGALRLARARPRRGAASRSSARTRTTPCCSTMRPTPSWRPRRSAGPPASPSSRRRRWSPAASRPARPASWPPTRPGASR